MADSILIVEDEVLVALEMESILEERGYEVVGIAADLEGALAFAGRNVDLACVWRRIEADTRRSAFGM